MDNQERYEAYVKLQKEQQDIDHQFEAIIRQEVSDSFTICQPERLHNYMKQLDVIQDEERKQNFNNYMLHVLKVSIKEIQKVLQMNYINDKIDELHMDMDHRCNVFDQYFKLNVVQESKNQFKLKMEQMVSKLKLREEKKKKNETQNQTERFSVASEFKNSENQIFENELDIQADVIKEDKIKKPQSQKNVILEFEGGSPSDGQDIEYSQQSTLIEKQQDLKIRNSRSQEILMKQKTFIIDFEIGNSQSVLMQKEDDQIQFKSQEVSQSYINLKNDASIVEQNLISKNVPFLNQYFEEYAQNSFGNNHFRQFQTRKCKKLNSKKSKVKQKIKEQIDSDQDSQNCNCCCKCCYSCLKILCYR